MVNYKFSVVVQKDKDGYTAFCPDLQGCYAQGSTYEEVIENIRDVIVLHIEDRISLGEMIEAEDMISLTSLEVTV